MRMGRQQQVVQALEQKITRPRNVLHLPWTGARFMAGVGTDLTTNQIIELAYLEWRAKGTRQQKTVLPGTPQMIGGGSYVVVDPAVLARTVRQFLNR
jgi:anionic cell wall polymer biosynthesis LytR-Cps2A-Psr (LCP) family protein